MFLVGGDFDDEGREGGREGSIGDSPLMGSYQG